MSNLISSLGYDYVHQMCTGAYFKIGNRVHYLRGVSPEGYNTKSFDLEGKPSWEAGTILPPDTLKSFAAFSFPKLGYRNIYHGKERFVVYISSRRSAMRGLRDEYISAAALPIHEAFDGDVAVAVWNDMRTPVRMMHIFKPQFISFAEGVKQLVSGDCCSFAVSEDLAVTMSIEANDGRLGDVLFRGKIVGKVMMDGTVALNNKILRRNALTQSKILGA